MFPTSVLYVSRDTQSLPNTVPLFLVVSNATDGSFEFVPSYESTQLNTSGINQINSLIPEKTPLSLWERDKLDGLGAGFTFAFRRHNRCSLFLAITRTFKESFYVFIF